MKESLEDIKKELQKDQQNPKTLQSLGSYYLNKSLYKQARDEHALASSLSPHVIADIMIAYEKFIAKSPKDIQARLALASFCISNKDFDSAALELEELLEIDKQNIQGYNILGKLYIAQNKIDESILLLEKAYKEGIKDVLISETLAAVYLEKGRNQEAIKFYEELPQSKKNFRTLGELYQRIGEFEKSASKYFEMFLSDPDVWQEGQNKLEELLQKVPRSQKIREFLADVYTKGMKPEKAVENLKEILRISSSNADLVVKKLKDILKTYPVHPEATILLAETLSAQKNYSEAIEEYHKLIKEKPEFTDKAIDGAKEIIKLFPDQFLAREFLVENYLEMDMFDLAISEGKELLNIYPDSAEWIIGKYKDFAKKESALRECVGIAYLIKGDYFNANLEAEKLVQSNPKNISGLILLGEVSLKQGHSKKAKELFRKALEKDPYNIEIHKKYREANFIELGLEAEQLKKRIVEDEWKMSLRIDLGKIYLEQGKNEEGIRELQIASKDTQKAPFVYNMLGSFYRKEGLYEQSIDLYKKGIQFSTSDSTDLQKKIKFGLALTYESQGNVKGALKLLEEIVQEDIDFAGIKEKIKFLKNASLASIQNKNIAILIKDSEKLELIGIWGKEVKKGASRQHLSVSFGQSYNNNGLESFFKGMYSSSEDEFALAMQLDPNYITGINNLAATQIVNKKYNEALNNLKKAFELDPSSPIILNNLGVAQFLSGNLSEAQYTLMRSLELNPEIPATNLNLADVQYKLGKTREAIDRYKSIKPYELTYDFAKDRLAFTA